MSTLSSASTLAQIEAAYKDNACYEEDASVAKAKIFVTACRLLIRTPSQISKTTSGMTFPAELLRKELLAAQAFIATHDTTGPTTTSAAVRGYDFADLR